MCTFVRVCVCVCVHVCAHVRFPQQTPRLLEGAKAHCEWCAFPAQPGPHGQGQSDANLIVPSFFFLYLLKDLPFLLFPSLPS